MLELCPYDFGNNDGAKNLALFLSFAVIFKAQDQIHNRNTLIQQSLHKSFGM